MTLHVVYLLFVQDTARAVFAKLGVTTKIDHRIQGVQTGCPHPIKEARYVMVPSGRMAYQCEAELLTAMARFRSGGGCEWFSLSSDESRSALNAALKASIPKFAGARHTWVVMTPAEIKAVAQEYGQEKQSKGVARKREITRRAVAGIARFRNWR